MCLTFGPNNSFWLSCFANFVLVILPNLIQTEYLAFWSAHRWKFYDDCC